MRAGGRWIDRDAGPVVRPYALTGGRTEPAGGGVLDLVALVVAVDEDRAGDPAVLPPEHRQILSLCRRPVTVADLAAATTLPVGVVRVLLGDLLAAGLIRVSRPVPPALLPDERIHQEVLHGLRAL